eukprot:7951525-Pyramimonas_sp.AAC.1
MSVAQFDAAAAVLSQSARDKLKHMRWKRGNGFEGLVSVKEAKNVQQAIDSKAAELQRARSLFDKAKIAVQKAAEQYVSSRSQLGKLEAELKQMVEDAKAKAARAPQPPAAESAVSAASHVAKVLNGHPGWQQQVGAALAEPLTALLQALTAHRESEGGGAVDGSGADAGAAAGSGGAEAAPAGVSGGAGG